MIDKPKFDHLDFESSALFQKLINTGRRYTSILGKILRRENNILNLNTLTALVPVISISSSKIYDVKTDEIIGTENRSQDFTVNFYPRYEWMKERWIKIYKLMHSKGISEPVKLIKYGGYYFVRDGNHRVSVAKNSGIEYITAEVTHYNLPFKLPDNLNYKNLDLLTEKYQFHKRTKIFNIINDTCFKVCSPRTWKKLETEIFVNSRSWFVRYYGRQPDNAVEFITTWLTFYKISVEHIHQRSLLLLFPGMCETDVFVEIVEFWNSHENPDSFWIGEIYDKFERYIRKKKIILWIHQLVNQLIRKFLSSSEDEKQFFLNSTRINKIIPDFNIPLAGKKFFSLCYKQIFKIYAKLYMQTKHKQPSLLEINNQWYESFYKPVLNRYRNKLYQITFEHYYILFSRQYYHKIIYDKCAIETSLNEFEKKLIR